MSPSEKLLRKKKVARWLENVKVIPELEGEN